MMRAVLFYEIEFLNQNLWPFTWNLVGLVDFVMTSHELFSNHEIVVGNFEKNLFHLVSY